MLLLISSCQKAPSAPSEPAAALAQPAEAAKSPKKSAPQTKKQKATNQKLSKRAQRAWTELADHADVGSDFYYLEVDGMLTLYALLQRFGTYEEVQNILGIPIFLSGPHENGKLNGNARSDFGHYNPKFVQGITAWALPLPNDKRFQRAAQAMYERGIDRIARDYWQAYQKLKQHPEFWAAEQKKLKNLLKKDVNTSAFYNRYEGFLSPEFMAKFDPSQHTNGGYNVNENPVAAVGFWIRRGIDGTAEDFAAGLRQLLETYDSEWLEENRTP